jgi:hypothetical protein
VHKGRDEVCGILKEHDLCRLISPLCPWHALCQHIGRMQKSPLRAVRAALSMEADSAFRFFAMENRPPQAVRRAELHFRESSFPCYNNNVKQWRLSKGLDGCFMSKTADMQRIQRLKKLADELSSLLREKERGMNGSCLLWKDTPRQERERDIRISSLLLKNRQV